MPDHDTFDLDVAFTAFAQHVAAVSTPRGSATAVSTARRRRRARWSAGLALVVLMAAGAAVAEGVAHDRAVEPADQLLPAPAVMDAGALSDATAGWAAPWQSTPRAMPGEPLAHACVKGPDEPDLPQPVRTSHDVLLATGDGARAFAQVDAYAAHSDGADQAFATMTRLFDACGASRTATESWAGGGAVGYLSPADYPGQHVWLAHVGDTAGIVWINGVAGQPSAEVEERVMRALVAAVQDPASYASGEVGASPSPGLAVRRASSGSGRGR